MGLLLLSAYIGLRRLVCLAETDKLMQSQGTVEVDVTPEKGYICADLQRFDWELKTATVMWLFFIE